jgi:hypothetical protein
MKSCIIASLLVASLVMSVVLVVMVPAVDSPTNSTFTRGIVALENVSAGGTFFEDGKWVFGLGCAIPFGLVALFARGATLRHRGESGPRNPARRRVSRQALLLGGLLTSLAGSAAGQITITSYNPSQYASIPGTIATFDTAIGIQNHTIEDFEDTTLIAGLQYSDTATASSGTVPAVAASATAQWDGAKMFPSHILGNYQGTTVVTHTFTYAAGTTSFGIGIGAIDVAGVPRLKVNGTDYGLISAFPNFDSSSSQRQVYLKIDATGGTLITSVSIFADFQPDVSGFNDGLAYDHVAVLSAIPEPADYAAIFSGLCVGFAWWRRRARPSVRTEP